MSSRNKTSRSKTSKSGKVEPRPAPRLYLVTPLVEDATTFAADLAAALAAGDVAAVLLRLAPADERTLINRAKALAGTAQSKDVALLLDGNVGLVARAGADGAHVRGLGKFTEAIVELKPAWIAGAGGMSSRHDAMTAAEVGADYIMFGEPPEDGNRPSFESIEERIAWWSEVFEAPCVAYAAAGPEVAPLVKAGADFIALGDWIWRDGAAVASTISQAAELMKLPETAA
jgi:thiamine-phosphate pyrophosphorylase